MGPSRSRRSVLASTLAIVTLATAGCGSSGGDAPSSALATTTAVDSAAGPLAFRHAAVGGGEIDFSSYAGKPVALWFWAPY